MLFNSVWSCCSQSADIIAQSCVHREFLPWIYPSEFPGFDLSAPRVVSKRHCISICKTVVNEGIEAFWSGRAEFHPLVKCTSFYFWQVKNESMKCDAPNMGRVIFSPRCYWERWLQKFTHLFSFPSAVQYFKKPLKTSTCFANFYLH